MEHKVTVVFSVEAASPTHAVQIVEKYLREKGVTAQGTVELTLGRTEERFGYTDLSPTVDNG